MQRISLRMKMMDPTDEEVEGACLSFRHDFGLLPDTDKQALRLNARWWLTAWAHALLSPPLPENMK